MGVRHSCADSITGKRRVDSGRAIGKAVLMAKWLLLDGLNLAFRAFYGMPELTRSDGFPTNAIHGWVRTLWYIEDDNRPERMVIFYDLGEDEQRKELLPDYKAQRTDTPPDLVKQLPFLKDFGEAMGFGRIEKAGVEADDLIGAAARSLSTAGDEVVIVSADKDLAQCIGPGVTQLLPPPTANPRLGWRKLDAEGVRKKFGVKPAQIADYLALVGDSADNIAGLRGVGPKTASKWLGAYGSLDGVIANCGMLNPKRFQNLVHQNVENLRKNLIMTTLRLDEDFGDLDHEPANPARVIALLEEMEMKRSALDAHHRYGVEI